MALVLAVALGRRPVFGGGGPENVAVAVNGDSWASLSIANEYVKLRGIPACNVIVLTDVPGFESVDVDAFRARILGPLLEQLDTRGLTPQIDYLIYSTDFPYAINVRKDLEGVNLPRIMTPMASINGLTYLHEAVRAKSPAYLQANANFYLRRPMLKRNDAPWSQEQARQYAQVFALMKDEKYAEAEVILRAVEQAHPHAAQLLYNLACCLARLDRGEEAVAALARAVDAGWADVMHTERDDDLARLRDRDDFKALVEKMNEQVFDIQPARGFRSARAWTPAGGEAEPGTPGARRYLLSSMLAVTSGRGTSVEEALNGLRRSAMADGTCPDGTIYFMKNDDIRSRTRRWAFRSAVEQLKKLGVKADVLNGILPAKKHDVMGLMAGSAVFDWAVSGSKILPGAICEHLTSTGGVMAQSGGQTPLSVFLRAGAAAAAGTVTEPYALQFKFPTAFMHVHYAHGCSLAEAFYQSLAGPYQLLIVGDPLCAPWALSPRVSVRGLRPREKVDAERTITFKTDPADSGRAVRSVEVYIDGLRRKALTPEQSYVLDPATLETGYHELRAVAIADTPIEQQGRCVIPFYAGAGGAPIRVKAPRRVAIDAPLKIAVESEGAKALVCYHFSRELGRVQGDRGTLTIDPVSLGIGMVELHVVGFADEAGAAATARAEPFYVEVEPPPATEPGTAGTPREREQGLVLTPDDGDAVVVTSIIDGNWLKQAGVEDGEGFSLDALFSAPADALYQLQVKTPRDIALEVDDRRITFTAALKWQYRPLTITAGTHRLRIVAAPGGPARLDMRFGAQGTRSLGAPLFEHTPLPTVGAKR